MAGRAVLLVPHRGETPDEAALPEVRAPVEHGFAHLKNWRILSKVRTDPKWAMPAAARGPQGVPQVAAGMAAYPLPAVMTLAETGTRALLGAVVGPYRGEVEAALQLAHHLGGGMLVLADRGFGANAFVRAVHASKAALPGRTAAALQGRRPP